MRKTLLLVILMLIAIVSIASCKKESCQHVDANDDALCDLCDESYTDGDEHTHICDKKVIDDAYLVTAADCENVAIYYYSCACGVKGTMTFTYGEPQHNYELQVVEPQYFASAADCNSPAKYYYSCACGDRGTQTFTYGEVSHNFVEQYIYNENYFVSAATCTTPAIYYYSCACGAVGTETFEYGETTKHVYNQQKEESRYLVSAKCGERATYYYSCVCGAVGTKTFTSSSVVEHKYDKEVIDSKYLVSAADCENAATYYYSCSCGKAGTETFEYGEPLAHSYTVENTDSKYLATAAECGTAATYYYSCVCGEMDAEENRQTFSYGDAHGYTEQNASAAYLAVDADCENAATYYYSCTCGAVGKATFSYGEPAGHKYSATVINPSAKEDGYTEHTCSECGNFYVDTFVVPVDFVITSENKDEIGYIGTEGEELVIPAIFKKDGTWYRVTSIEAYAFSSSTNLKSVVVPESVVSIGEGAFMDCSSLESITLPFVGDSVKTSDDAYQYPFGYIFGTWFYDGGVETEQRYHGVSSNYTATGVYYIPASLKSVTVTGGNILYGAFWNCTGLTNVTLPDDLTAIGSYAFFNCTGLKSITIPERVNEINNAAFKGCTSLTDVTVPNSVTSIAMGAFAGCTSLESITLPFIGGSNKTSSDAFQYPLGFIFGNDSTAGGVATRQTYYGAGGKTLTNNIYYIPASLKYVTVTGGNILYGAFYNCTGLVGVTLGDGVSIINSYAFYNNTALTSVVIGDGVTSIAAQAFSGCCNLSSVTLGSSVTSIGTEAFTGCIRLVEVINRSSLEITKGASTYGAIATYALEVHSNDSKVVNKDGYLFYTFDGVNYLVAYLGKDTAITLPLSFNGQNYVINKNAFNNCDKITSVVIPDRVTGIGYYAFYGCDALTEITIGKGVASIDNRAFYISTKLANITVDDGNQYYKSIDGNLYTKDGKTLVSYAIGNGRTSFTIPDGVTAIGDYAFYNCTTLTSLTIPDSVTSIGEYAFFKCTKLASVDLGNGVTTIGDNAFRGCEALTSLTIPDSVIRIGNYAFRECTKLASVTIGKGITEIGTQAFYKCSKLASIQYLGTEEMWNTITKGDSWNKEVAADCQITYTEE